jgi:hypothetical protein
MEKITALRLHPFIENDQPVLFDRAALHTFCELNQLALPDTYIEFLTKSNGGRIDHRQRVCFETLGPRRIKKRIHNFYPSNPSSKWESIESNWRLCATFYPPYLFPFADTELDNLLCLKASGPSLGSILYVDQRSTKLTPETTSEEVEAAKGVYTVANSFAEFCDALEIGD